MVLAPKLQLVLRTEIESRALAVRLSLSARGKDATARSQYFQDWHIFGAVTARLKADDVRAPLAELLRSGP